LRALPCFQALPGKPSGKRLVGLAAGWFDGANRRAAAGGLLPKEGLAGAFFCGGALTRSTGSGIVIAGVLEAFPIKNSEELIMEGKKILKEHDRIYEYWTDGQKAYFSGYEIKGLDIETFEQYPGGWGKDKNHCYSAGTKLKNADVGSFKALNFTYAKDNANVWTFAGKIKDADAKTFEVCDNGKYSLGKNRDENVRWYELFVPYGFGKDANNVYYFDSSGKPNIVKNASPKTFVSLDDGYFGYDDKNVYCGINKLPKADPKTWGKLKGLYHYSKDRKTIYYLNRAIKEADAETFEIMEKDVELGLPIQLAKDKNNYYWNERITAKEKAEELLGKV